MRKSLSFGGGALDLDRLVGQDRQGDGTERRGDEERHSPIDAGTLQDAPEEERGGDPQGEAGAE